MIIIIIMNPIIILIIAIILSIILPFDRAVAFPDGSPVCTVGTVAPQSLHLDRLVTITGPIPTNQFQVTIGESLVLNSTVVNQITPGVDLAVKLVTTAGIEFRGLLIVINKDGLDLSLSLQPTSSNVKAQAECPDRFYSGITHVINSVKSSVEGKLLLGQGVTAFLDVNIVVSNSDELGSTYYYTRYSVSTVAQSPSAAPVPTSAPIPIPIPVAPPIPVSAPIVPVSPPSQAPVVTTSIPTTGLPTSAPFVTPTCGSPPIREKPCGLFGLGIFCRWSQCGWVRRLLGKC